MGETGPSLLNLHISTLNMEELFSSETLITTCRTIRSQNPQYHNLNYFKLVYTINLFLLLGQTDSQLITTNTSREEIQFRCFCDCNRPKWSSQFSNSFVAATGSLWTGASCMWHCCLVPIYIGSVISYMKVCFSHDEASVRLGSISVR